MQGDGTARQSGARQRQSREEKVQRRQSTTDQRIAAASLSTDWRCNGKPNEVFMKTEKKIEWSQLSDGTVFPVGENRWKKLPDGDFGVLVSSPTVSKGDIVEAKSGKGVVEKVTLVTKVCEGNDGAIWKVKRIVERRSRAVHGKGRPSIAPDYDMAKLLFVPPQHLVEELWVLHETVMTRTPAVGYDIAYRRARLLCRSISDFLQREAKAKDSALPDPDWGDIWRIMCRHVNDLAELVGENPVLIPPFNPTPKKEIPDGTQTEEH